MTIEERAEQLQYKLYITLEKCHKEEIMRDFRAIASEIKKRCMEEVRKLKDEDSGETVSDIRRLQGIIEGYEAAIQAINRMEIE